MLRPAEAAVKLPGPAGADAIPRLESAAKSLLAPTKGRLYATTTFLLLTEHGELTRNGSEEVGKGSQKTR